MHRLSILLMALLVSSCAQLPPTAIQDAPKKHDKAVVFDIDGTLTPTPLKFWKARTDAAKTVHYFADKGMQIIYLTARVEPLQSNIPSWLKDNGFPDGSIHVTESAEDRNNHAQFKARILREFVAHGWIIEYAYGDSSTDFEAYAAVGIPKEHVFALLREGDTACQPGVWKVCLNGWTGYIDSLAK